MSKRSWLSAVVAVVALILLASACSDDDGATVRDIGEDSSDSGTGSGSASGSGSPSGSSSAPSGSGSSPSAAGDGGYEYASNVDAHRLVVADICPIGELLDAGDFEAVADIYREGGSSVNSDGSVRTIAGFATSTDRMHGLDTYYDSATPLDDFVSAALEGSGIFEGQPDAVRAQAVEKGIQNQVMVAWTVHELNSALAKARDGNFDVAEGAVHNWDEAWAFFHGSEPGCSPYATGNSRASNFGTLGADGETAKANEAILAAMIEGRDALLAQDADTAEDAAAEVVRNVVITYSQAVIRYASLIEDDLADDDVATAKEHQAEGLAFWRVIEAYVASEGADVEAVNAVVDLRNEPGENGFGDEVRAALGPAWASMGIDAADIGTLR